MTLNIYILTHWLLYLLYQILNYPNCVTKDTNISLIYCFLPTWTDFSIKLMLSVVGVWGCLLAGGLRDLHQHPALPPPPPHLPPEAGGGDQGLLRAGPHRHSGFRFIKRKSSRCTIYNNLQCMISYFCLIWTFPENTQWFSKLQQSICVTFLFR